MAAETEKVEERARIICARYGLDYDGDEAKWQAAQAQATNDHEAARQLFWAAKAEAEGLPRESTSDAARRQKAPEAGAEAADDEVASPFTTQMCKRRRCRMPATPMPRSPRQTRKVSEPATPMRKVSEPATPMPNYTKYTVKRLREICRANEWAPTGQKSDLVLRCWTMHGVMNDLGRKVKGLPSASNDENQTVNNDPPEDDVESESELLRQLE